MPPIRNEQIDDPSRINPVTFSRFDYNFTIGAAQIRFVEPGIWESHRCFELTRSALDVDKSFQMFGLGGVRIVVDLNKGSVVLHDESEVIVNGHVPDKSLNIVDFLDSLSITPLLKQYNIVSAALESLYILYYEITGRTRFVLDVNRFNSFIEDIKDFNRIDLVIEDYQYSVDLIEPHNPQEFKIRGDVTQLSEEYVVTILIGALQIYNTLIKKLVSVKDPSNSTSGEE